jgi:hypothetical protein
LVSTIRRPCGRGIRLVERVRSERRAAGLCGRSTDKRSPV